MTDERTLTLFDRINLANCAMQQTESKPSPPTSIHTAASICA